MRRILSFFLALLVGLTVSLTAAEETNPSGETPAVENGSAESAAEASIPTLESSGGKQMKTSYWMNERREKLTVGNPTPMTGRFFPGLWGGTTSDLDVQDLVHGYYLVLWDNDLVRFRFDHSVVQNVSILDDAKGNRTFLIVLHEIGSTSELQSRI